MSSLIFHTEKNQVLAATDTLAVSYEKCTAFMFTTKAFIIPHLRMIVCGTGVGGFCGKWFIQINDRMVLRGIDNLDYHTPGNLATLWHNHKEEFFLPDNVTTTIYHFGFSEEDGLIHSYAYRSANNFESETLHYGIGVKPECEIPEKYELPNDIVKMMQQQRAIQSARPKQERVYIGGEIQIHHLSQHGFSVYTLGKFEDFTLDEQAIYENFSSP